MGISIHTALAGCDEGLGIKAGGFFISIHTALAGCDVRQHGLVVILLNFNPHSPRRL